MKLSETGWRSILFTISIINSLYFNITLINTLELWIISKISGSSLITGILFSLISIPFFFSYFTGTIVDTIKNKKIILLAFSFLLLVILFLSQLELLVNNLFALILLFYIMTLLTGFIFDISGAIMSIWIKENINEEIYKKVSSINQIIARSLGLFAGVLAGIFLTVNLKYSLFGPLFLLGITIFLLLPIKISSTKGIKKSGLKEGFIEGFNYIRKNKVLTQFVILTIGNFFFNMQGLLLLFYVEDFLHKGPIFFSMLGAVSEIGIILGSAYAPKIKKGKLGFYHVLFGTFISASLMSYILIHNVFLAVIPTFAVSFFSGINSVLTSSVLLRVIDKEYMGRVRGTISAISEGLVTFSGPLGGVLIAAMGIGQTYLLVGLVMLIFFYLELAFKEFYNLRI
ncbi:MFS transporter [Sulfuracidifex metallicus]|uniref:MFS transporter n=1 Tax=Sulfuracidifex metallicus TaxID=47303 RepID=UPI0012DBFEA2|nr:MFS transporter [Sulfuracidifex metallicus]